MSAPLNPKDLLHRVPTPLIRGLTVLGCFAVFVTAASLFTPDDSRALPADGNAPPQGALHERVNGEGGAAGSGGVQRYVPTTEPALVGALVGVKYTVDIYITPKGARYTVKDPSGRVLAEQISADDLYRDFPDLDVDQMRAEAPVDPLAD